LNHSTQPLSQKFIIHFIQESQHIWIYSFYYLAMDKFT